MRERFLGSNLPYVNHVTEGCQFVGCATVDRRFFAALSTSVARVVVVRSIEEACDVSLDLYLFAAVHGKDSNNIMGGWRLGLVARLGLGVCCMLVWSAITESAITESAITRRVATWFLY